MVTDDAVGELYVADGYGNRRIVVFDAKTGAYKHHWGADGTKTPTDEKLAVYPWPSPICRDFLHLWTSMRSAVAILGLALLSRRSRSCSLMCVLAI